MLKTNKDNIAEDYGLDRRLKSNVIRRFARRQYDTRETSEQQLVNFRIMQLLKRKQNAVDNDLNILIRNRSSLENLAKYNKDDTLLDKTNLDVRSITPVLKRPVMTKEK